MTKKTEDEMSTRHWRKKIKKKKPKERIKEKYGRMLDMEEMIKLIRALRKTRKEQEKETPPIWRGEVER